MLNETDSRAVARLLCDAAQALHNEYDAPFSMGARVGRGRATNCRTQGGHERFLLTFGWKNVSEKFDPARAQTWLTYREVRDRFALPLTLLNVLAQTVLHEYAHCVDLYAREGRRATRHHPPSFYACLARLHAQGYLTLVREYLQRRADNQGLTLKWHSAPPAPKAVRKPRVGDRIEFQYRGKRICAPVISVGPQRAKAMLLPSSIWRVPFQLIDRILKPGDSQ